MKKSNNQQLLLLTFFEEDEYTEKEFHGFMLVKNWDGNTKEWRVNVYTMDTFKKYKEFTNNLGEKKTQEEHLRSIIRGE